MDYLISQFTLKCALTLNTFVVIYLYLCTFFWCNSKCVLDLDLYYYYYITFMRVMADKYLQILAYYILY